MLKYKYFGVVVTAAILAMTVASCGGNDATTPPAGNAQVPINTTASPTSLPPTTTPPATTPAPDVIIKSMSTAAVGMNTYESKMVMVMDMAFLGMAMKIDMTSNMTVDVPGNKYFMIINGQSVGMGESQTISEQMYLINGTMYTKFDIAEPGFSPNTWYKTIIPAVDLAEMWKAQDVGDQFRLLVEGASAQVVSSEVVNGVDCFKIKMTPLIDKLMAYLAASGSDVADLGIANPAQAFKQLDLTIWVSKTTYLPARMDMIMSIALESENMTITMNMSATYDKVNQPVTITLPSAAQAALPMPG